MKPVIYQVDSFTNKAFYGNPAGVCVLTSPISEASMLKIAAEMNVSETAFVWPEDNHFRLRWFTPTVEVDLCGHATLATAHILFEKKIVSTGLEIEFQTLSGILLAKKGEAGIELDFPVRATEKLDGSHLRLSEILGVAPSFVGKAGDNLLIEIESAQTVRTLAPNLLQLGKLDFHGVMVTALSDSPEYDFVSRYFAPSIGIDEDPVTGMAHCILAPYFAPKIGKTEMVGYQASARGGIVRVRLDGDRAILSGDAVTVIEGRLAVDVD